MEQDIRELSEKLKKKAETVKKRRELAVNVDLGNFKDFVKEGVAVLDFWAPWCAPCHLYEPVFERVAEKFQGKVKFGRVNVDENQPIADQFQILNIPSTLIFKDGKQVDLLVGLVEEEELEAHIRKAL